MVTVVYCLAEKENRGGHCQKAYAYTNGRMVKTVAKPLNGNVRDFFKYLF